MRSFMAVMMLFALSSAPCFELFSAAPEKEIFIIKIDAHFDEKANPLSFNGRKKCVYSYAQLEYIQQSNLVPFLLKITISSILYLLITSREMYSNEIRKPRRKR